MTAQSYPTPSPPLAQLPLVRALAENWWLLLLRGVAARVRNSFALPLSLWQNRRKASSRSDGPSGPQSTTGLSPRDNRDAQPFAQSDLQLLEPPRGDVWSRTMCQGIWHQPKCPPGN